MQARSGSPLWAPKVTRARRARAVALVVSDILPRARLNQVVRGRCAGCDGAHSRLYNVSDADQRGDRLLATQPPLASPVARIMPWIGLVLSGVWRGP
jgi:hypothetical protein